MNLDGTTEKDVTPFSADVAQLLKLMVHSVYSNRDVFLRELVANAADACERLRTRSLTDPALLDGDTGFEIVVAIDKPGGRIAVIDNGSGMTREEMAENLGTIARSGTRAFVEALGDGSDSGALIGQFGVGFYSAFMVAREIRVTSRAAGSEEAWTWVSDGAGGFTIEPAVAADAPARGTRVELTLADDALDYADEDRLERILKEHAAHVPIPVAITEAGSDVRRRVVDGTALWTRPKSSVSEAEYREFFTFISGDPDAPALTVHYRAEGRQDYSVLAFVPSRRPFDLFEPDRRGKMKLYVRRMFITDEAALLPGWLRFVRGIVDSEDLPLNLSREMLQANPLLDAIRRGVTSRIVTEIERMAERDEAGFLKLWEAFGAVLKEGLYEDPERRDALLKIARFRTTRDPDGWRSLATIVADLRENQTAIYYALGDDAKAVAASPHLEGYKARGVEVLLLTDPVDAFWVQTTLGFDGKPFKSVTRGAADLDLLPLLDAEEAGEAARPADLAVLIALFKEHLAEETGDVRPSTRLAESAVCLVAPEYGPDRQLERLLRRSGERQGGLKPILELNPRHPLVRTLAKRAAAGGAVEALGDAAHLLFDEARILEGDQPADPAAFSARLTRVLEAALGGS